MQPEITPEESAFAPAARAGENLLAWQHNAFLSDATAVALLEAMPGPAMVLNRQRQIVAANSQLQVLFSAEDCAHLIGKRPGEALGCVRARERSTGCGTTAACAQCGAVQAILESISTHGRSVNECRVRTSSKDGEGAFDFRVYATWAEIGNEDMVVLALQDISSEKRRQVLEHTLLDASSEAERAPAQAADANPEAEERFHREFGDMSSRILDQIEWHRQLLAAEGGTLQVNDEEVNVHGLLERRVAESRSNWAGRGREVSVRDRGFDWVRTDPGLLGRALDGLLRNALEATPEGGSVEVRAMHDGYALEIAVRNAGVIPDAVQHQIFQRSFSTKHGDGHGIGTYSVKLLVERYLGGSVEFTSDAEHGTTFTVVVPDRSPRRAAA